MMMELISRLVGIHEVGLFIFFIPIMVSLSPFSFSYGMFYLMITFVLASFSSSIITPSSRGSFSPIREVSSPSGVN